MTADTMKAVRVHRFGGIDTLVYEDIPRPTPGAGEVLVRVGAAGVGPWDALIRTGKSELHQPLPVTLGSDLSGVVEYIGPGVSAFQAGDAVFGVTNSLFTGAYAEYAVVDAGMIARKPPRLTDVEAASVPVVAVTAWQMLFDHGQVQAGQRVLVQGGAGSVGAYAVQLAKNAGAEVMSTAFAKDMEFVRACGADRVIDASAVPLEDAVRDVDIVLDTVGGETQQRSLAVLKQGGVLVSSVSLPDQAEAARRGVRGVFFYVNVTSACLAEIAMRLDTGRLTLHVGEVLPLSQARTAHEMLAGAPHRRGKIVLTTDAL